MANLARKYHSAESLAASTTTSATYQTKVTLTYTPDANSTYAYLWSCELQGTASTAIDSRVQLQNNAGTVLCNTNVEPKDTTDVFPLSGFAIETFGASPTSQSITLKYSAETTSQTASIANARVIAIKLTADDQYVENTADVSTTSTADVTTATTLTFTPASTGNFLILGYCEHRSAAVATTVTTQLTNTSGPTAYSVHVAKVNDTTNYVSNFFQANVGSLSATSQTFRVHFITGTSGTTVNCRNSKILALRLDQFTSNSISSDNTRTTSTSASYVNKLTTGSISHTDGLTYLLIGSASVDYNSTTTSGSWRFMTDSNYDAGVAWCTGTMESPSVANVPSRVGGLYLHTQGTATTTFDYLSEGGTVDVGADDVIISVLQLVPDDLYWVGGTGTWDSSAATNWALTSGGSASFVAPVKGTNVYFDSASDSGAGFTVTISTGAVCRNLTASSLDNTMTWSGSAAMSVYGNFSVPASNFTQSYTGTITHAGSTGDLGITKTITTNGKSFTAFTFDGASSTMTLSDATTLTGAATLTAGSVTNSGAFSCASFTHTAGTLTLGAALTSTGAYTHTAGTIACVTYALTCDTFNSSNANTRTINFGTTGKIVVTSSSAATVWDTSTLTNLTVSGTSLVELTGGGATTKTINSGLLTEANSISFSLLNTAGTVTFTSTNVVKNLVIGNNSFTLSNVALTIYGGLTINGTTPTLTAGTAVWTFAATSGTYTITTNGKTLDFPITWNGVGGTWILGSNLTVGTTNTRTNTLLAGTLDLGSYSYTIYGVFNTNTTGVRRIQMSGTGGKFVFNVDQAVTVLNSSTITNMTTDGNVVVEVTGGGAVTKTISAGTLSEANAISFVISAVAGTVAFTASNTMKNLTLSNTSYTLSNIAITIYGNLLVSGTTPTLTAGTAAMTFAATSGTKTITTNTKTLDFPVTFNGIGGTWELQDALTVGTSTARTVTLTNGTFNLNNFTVTIFGLFSSSIASARTLAFGSTGKIVMTTTAAVSTNIVTMTTATNLTVTGTNPLIQVTGSGVGPLNISAASSINIQLSPASAATFAVTGSLNNFTLDNTANITLNNDTRSIFGNLLISGTNPTLTGGTLITTFAATSGTKTITTSGKTLDFPITFNGVGGTWQLQDALSVGIVGTEIARDVTLTNGTFDLNNFTVTIHGAISSSNSNIRTIAFGSTGKFVMTGNSSTSFNITALATDTNLTVTGTDPLIQFTGGDAANAGLYNFAGVSRYINLQLSPTALASIDLTNGMNDLRLDNNANILLNNASRTIYGNLSIGGTSPTLTSGTLGTTFAATSGTKTITSNGATIDFPVTFDGVGGTWQLQDNFTFGTSTSRNLTLSNGTFDINSKNCTIFGTFQSNNSNTRRIQNTGGTGKFIMTINTGTNFWNTSTATGLTTDGNIIIRSTGGGSNTKGINTGAIPETDAVSVEIANTAGTIGFVSSGNSVKNLTLENTAFTLSNVAITIYGNLTIAGTTPTLTAGTAAWTFAATSGTKTITTSGENLGFPVTFNGAGGTWSLQDDLEIGTSTARNFSLTAGTFDLNSKNVTLFGQFLSSNSNTRRIQNTGGLGKIIITLTTAVTLWSCFTTTNFTTDGLVIVRTTGGGAVTKLIDSGTLSEANSISFEIANTAGSLNFTSTNTVKNLTLEDRAYTFGNIDITIYGNFTVGGTTPTLSAGATALTFAATSGTKTITTNNKTLDFPLTFNGAGGTWVVTQALTVGTTTSRTVTLTAGTLDIYSNTFTLYGIFSSSNTNTRRIQNTGGIGKIVLSIDTSVTPWDTGTVTNMTTDGLVIVRTTGFGGAGGGITRTINSGALSESSAISFEIANTSGTTTFTDNNTVKNLILENIAYTFSNITLTIYGDFTIAGATPTLTAGTNTWTFAATSGTKTITTSGDTIDWPITFDGLGGTWSLQDAFTMAASKLATLTAGTLNLNSQTLTATGGFAVTGTGVKVLAHGSGDIVISLASATAFNATGSNLTSTGTGRINMTAATDKTFVGGGNSYNTLNQGGAGALTITGSNTFKNITNTVQPATVRFTSGTNNTFTEAFSLSGTAGNLITLGSTTSASHTLTKTFNTDVNVSYVSLSYSTAVGTSWYALKTNNNVDDGNNSGWIFQLGSSAFLVFF